MLIDHVGAILYPGEHLFRYVGRLAFPIFCFLLVEGFIHTRNVWKYMGRLGLFALLSEIPYDLAFHKSFWAPEKQNVFFTLCIGLGMLCILNKERESVVKAGVVILAMWAAELLRTDYGFLGVLLIEIFWLARKHRLAGGILAAGWNFLWQNPLQYAGALAVIPIAAYNGKKGRSMKYFFYLFYPTHLLILYLIAENFAKRPYL